MIQDNQYTFDDITGKLVIIAEAVNADISITAISQNKPTPGPETFKVVYTFEKPEYEQKVIVVSSEAPTVGKDYKSTFKFKDGWWSEYKTIDIVSIVINDKILTKDTEYVYEWINSSILEQSYGELTIFKEQVIADITICLSLTK